MKKRICITVLLAALLLTGCGSMPLDILERIARSSSEAGEESAPREEDGAEADEEASGEKQNGMAAKDQEDAESAGASGESRGIWDAAEDGSGQGGETEGQDGAEDSYVKGTITEDGWENETWNLRFTAPEGVFMLGEDALEALMGIGEEIVWENYSDAEREYMELTHVYEMMGMTADGGTNVALTVEKLLMTGMETEDYRKAMLLQLHLSKNPAYTILEDEGTAQIAGETYAVVTTKVEKDGGYLQDYYVRVDDDKALAIIMTYKEETADKVGEILAGFDVY